MPWPISSGRRPPLAWRGTEAHIEQRRRAQRVGAAEDHLAIELGDEAIGRATGGRRQARLLHGIRFPMAVAPEDVQLRAQVVVDLDVALVVPLRGARQGLVVVGEARPVGRRQFVQHLAPEGRQLAERNLAVRVQPTGQRALQRHRASAGVREEPLPLFERRDGGQREGARHAPEALVVGEKEELVFADGSAERRAELILHERGLLVLARLKETDGVQLGVAQELPSRAMELVGPAAHRGVDDRPAGAAILGRVIVGDHLELRHRIGRQLHHLVRKALVRSAIRVVVHSVDDEVVQRRSQTVYVKRRVARTAAFAGEGEHAGAHAGRKQGQIRIGASVQRQVDNFVRADHLAAIARLGFERAHRFGDGDRIASGPHFHLEVHALPGTHDHLELGGLRGGESGLLAAYQIAANADVEEFEVARGVGIGRGLHTRGRIEQRYASPRDGRLRGVANRAQHGGGFELCERGSAPETRKQKEGSQTDEAAQTANATARPFRSNRASMNFSRLTGIGSSLAGGNAAPGDRNLYPPTLFSCSKISSC